MLRRARARADVPTPRAADVAAGVHTQAALVADPDGPNIARNRALLLQIGGGLQGGNGAGVVINYDRGDPGRSFNGVLGSVAMPTAAIGRLGRPADLVAIGPADFTDSPVTATTLGMGGSRQATLFARIAR